MLQQAIDLIKQGECSVAAVTSDGRILTGNGRTVRPLFRLYNDHKPDLRGAAVADRIIGKAAAALLADAGVAQAYGFLMSESGLAMLRSHGITAGYKKLVPEIENRDGSAACPSELAVAGSDDPAVCVRLVTGFIETVPEPVWD